MAQIGSVLDGKYEILKKIGEGGMSVVYLAMDKRINKQWAVKEIKRTATKDNAVVVQSLLTEANLMERLDHPALPRIVNIIETGDIFYIVMDYIEGETLTDILRREGAQPEEMVISWAKTLCDVLQYLHAQNPPIIYRDMKPDNLMLKPEGNLKVIDFGIAREFKELNTQDTNWLGTRGYAAPEQFGGQGQTDARTDIYCLGATLYHLVTGHNPAEPPYEIYPIRQWNPALSRGLEKIILKCTQLNPRDRYQSATELLYDLEHYDEVDDVYRKKQKKRVTAFCIVAGLCVLFAGIGVAGQMLSAGENNRNYDAKINISPSTDIVVKTATYEEAIAIKGGDTRAYSKLLDAYADNNLFGDGEAGLLSALYNRNKDQFDKESEEYLALNYKIGTTYFYLYSGSDASFRARVFKSLPYFTVVVESGHKSFSQYAIAESYYIVGTFYTRYVANTTGVKEPTAEAYAELLSSLDTCMNNVENYDSDDAAYIRLTMYKEISNLLYDHRKGLAARKIPEAEVLSLLERAHDAAEQVSVTQAASISIRDSILASYADYISAIGNTYLNTKERQ